MTPLDPGRQNTTQDAKVDVDSEELHARIPELEATVEAPGRAIGLLCRLNEHAPATPETTEPPAF